ncbi:MAG: hypothetical protein AAGK05_18775, partial [Pseudomonadota bacterium]
MSFLEGASALEEGSTPTSGLEFFEGRESDEEKDSVPTQSKEDEDVDLEVVSEASDLFQEFLQRRGYSQTEINCLLQDFWVKATRDSSWESLLLKIVDLTQSLTQLESL